VTGADEAEDAMPMEFGRKTKESKRGTEDKPAGK
jgi:hypothetical protein